MYSADQKKHLFWHIIIAIIMIILLIPYITNAYYFGHLDYVNLFFYVAGRYYIGIFTKNQIGVLEGTIWQLFVPLVFLIYFLIKKNFGALFFSLFWFFENFVNISIYMTRAIYYIEECIFDDYLPPIMSRQRVFYDWVNDCPRITCLRSIETAMIVQTVGGIGMIVSIIALGVFVLYRAENPVENNIEG